MPHWNVAILIFDDVEVLDFCGPFEVFSVTTLPDQTKPFTVYTVAEQAQLVRARNDLCVQPHFDFLSCPPPDILVIPGGWGTRAIIKKETIVDWVKNCAERARIVFSVCTGALVLGKAGLLDGLSATTHHASLELLEQVAPGTKVVSNRRYIDNGTIITAGGISAGIDGSLHIVARLLGDSQARATAKYMEYRWAADDLSVDLS